MLYLRADCYLRSMCLCLLYHHSLHHAIFIQTICAFTFSVVHCAELCSAAKSMPCLSLFLSIEMMIIIIPSRVCVCKHLAHKYNSRMNALFLVEFSKVENLPSCAQSAHDTIGKGKNGGRKRTTVIESNRERKCKPLTIHCISC